MIDERQEDIALRFFDGSYESAVDAETLSRILSGLQRAVHIVAMDERHADPASSSYVPTNIQRAFPVLCHAPRKGSYLLPVIIGSPFDTTAHEESGSIVATITTCLTGVTRGDHESIAQSIQSGRLRIRILDAFRKMLPQAGTTWKLGFGIRGTEIVLDATATKKISEIKDRLREQRTERQSIVGTLQAMNFEARKVTILYPETNSEMECFYDAELEMELIDTRRDYVQVTGLVVLDGDGIPKKIKDVESIQVVDLSEFIVPSFNYDGKIMRFKEPLILTPELSECKQLMTLTHDNLGIEVFAVTREALLDELQEQLEVLWHEYALEEDEKLSPKAIELKNQLLAAIVEG